MQQVTLVGLTRLSGEFNVLIYPTGIWFGVVGLFS